MDYTRDMGKFMFDYFSLTDGVKERGCVSSLTESKLQECLDGVTCKICHGNNCNQKREFQRCATCNSEDDVNCATVKNNLTEKVCSDYLDVCKLFVKPNTTTHRGCLKGKQIFGNLRTN